MVGRADGGSFSIECFVSFEPLKSTSEDESLISLLAGDGQRFTALDIGRRTQRGIEIAAARCTWSSSSDASPFYGPFDISACRACRRQAVARKIIILAHLVQIARSLARSLGMLLLVACCLGRSKPGAAPHAIARFPIFHAHPFIACYSSNFGPLHNVGEEEEAHSMKECRRFDTARSSVPLDFSFMGVIIISSTLRCIECSSALWILFDAGGGRPLLCHCASGGEGNRESLIVK